MRKPILFIAAILLLSCNHKEKQVAFSRGNLQDFNPTSYELKGYDTKLVRGQVLYLPIYSNIPHFMDSVKIDMSAFVAFHNTDFTHSIKLQKVQYFDTKGKLVHDFLQNSFRELGPLETADFYVPYQDQSGTGANFLIEWRSDSLVNEPLVESVTINTKIHNCVAVLSQGKVIKEIK